MENSEWVIKVFAFIGIAVCVIVTLIALVWAVCFAVKLLIKTFGVRVGKSYDVMVEDITQKTEAKKERKKLSRKASAEKKMELLNMKLASKQKIHEMKKQKLAEKLAKQETDAREKILGEGVENKEPDTFETEVEPEVVKIYETFEEKPKTKKKSNKKSKQEDEKMIDDNNQFDEQ